MIEEEVLGWARGHYTSAKRLDGDASILDGKIAACEPEKMSCVVLTPAEGRAFMDMLGIAERTGAFEVIASTDDEEGI